MSDEITNDRFFDFWILEMKNLHWLVLMCLLFIVARFVTFAENIIRKEKVCFCSDTLPSLLAKILVNFDEPNKTVVVFLFAFGALLPQNLRVVNNWLMGLFLGVSNFVNWYPILLIRSRRFRIFFPNHSSVIRSRASILLIIGGKFHSQSGRPI